MPLLKIVLGRNRHYEKEGSFSSGQRRFLVAQVRRQAKFGGRASASAKALVLFGKGPRENGVSAAREVRPGGKAEQGAE